jgi:plastocyanin
VLACLPAGAAASVRTTEPQQIYHATVTLRNTGIAFKPSTVTRGALMLFKVKNAAKSPRDFFIGGYALRRLKPGATRRFELQFLYRGKYRYVSTGHPGKKFTGALVVT